HCLTSNCFKIFLSRPPSGGAADTLALVHTDTGRRDFRVRFSKKRIVTARFYGRKTGRIEWKVAVRKEKRRRVPNQPRRLPRLHESQLLRKTLWVGCCRKCFPPRERRRCVMAMRLFILGTEARHYHIRLEIPDYPHDVGKHFVVTPDAERFVSAFGHPEIDRSCEELPGMVDPSRIEQFLCSNNAEPLAQFRADQILAAGPARHRKISGVVK